MARRFAQPSHGSSYRVLICDAYSGSPLNLDGTYVLGRPCSPPVFEKIDQARQFAEEILGAIPYGEAWIGVEGDPRPELVLSPHFPIYDRERRHFEFWFSLPFWRRWFTPRPQFTLYKPPTK